MVADKIYQLIPESMPHVIGELPGATQECVAILEYGGMISTEYFGTGQQYSSVLTPVVKLLIRHPSYDVGSQWADQLKTLLHRYTDDYFMSIMLVGAPIYLGRNEQRVHEFQITFKTEVKE